MLTRVNRIIRVLHLQFDGVIYKVLLFPVVYSDNEGHQTIKGLFLSFLLQNKKCKEMSTLKIICK